MHPSEPALRVAIGVSGSGKSYYVKNEVLIAARTIPVMVIDMMREWPAVPIPNDLMPYAAPAYDVATAIKAVAAGKRLVVIQPADMMAASIQAAEWARQYPGVAGLAIHECHHVAPVNQPMPIEIDRIATQWRHHRVAFWADCQRIARLHHSITDNARELRLFAQWGDLDLKRVKEIGGQPLVDAINDCARRFAPTDEGGQNEPGWHVRLGVLRTPPFQIVRV